MKIICVAAARPNFMKIAPLMDVFQKTPEIEPFLVHTGQHYDEKMSGLFFKELGIPEPNVNLGIGSGSHILQIAEVMRAFEQVCLDERPDAVLVVGDVNGTVACGLVAVKMGIKLIHVEAGLRSGDRAMPEEINRIVTDSISDILFCTEKSGIEHLRAENVPDEKVFLVGNVMIDTLLKNRAKADQTNVLEEMGLTPKEYATATLHRPSNVDDPVVFSELLDALDVVQREIPIVFPIHPRTRKNLAALGLKDKVENMKNLKLVDPQGYLEFLKLNANARVVLTDSGGLQEETTILGTPCITIRENTERPITCEVGTNQLVGVSKEAIVAAYERVKRGEFSNRGVPEFWDGLAAERIAKILVEKLAR